jgi:hypothetical protein
MTFGDYKSYQNKFMTCARVRPLESQHLGADFYRKESTKPLFAEHELLTIDNLYRYRIIMELFKIVKFRTPMSLFSLLNVSDRKDTLLITPSPTKHFIYKSAFHWNSFRKVIGTVIWGNFGRWGNIGPVLNSKFGCKLCAVGSSYTVMIGLNDLITLFYSLPSVILPFSVHWYDCRSL